MTDIGRISCCVAGCRRSTKRLPRYSRDVRILCGKHWRGVKRERPDIARLQREARRQIIVLERRSRKRETIRLMRLIERAYRRHHRRWEMGRLEAQRQQDAGFFAVRVRRRKRVVGKSGQNSSGIASVFEQQFQRLKSEVDKSVGKSP